MPRTQVVFFCEEDGTVPVLAWLDTLPTKAQMLYFFHGYVAAVLSHGLVKERVVPPAEINLATKRKRNFERNPERHTHREG